MEIHFDIIHSYPCLVLLTTASNVFHYGVEQWPAYMYVYLSRYGTAMLCTVLIAHCYNVILQDKRHHSKHILELFPLFLSIGSILFLASHAHRLMYSSQSMNSTANSITLRLCFADHDVLNLPPCQIEIIHKVYPPIIHVLYACVYMLRIHLMYNLCSRSKYTCYPLWRITRVALDV